MFFNNPLPDSKADSPIVCLTYTNANSNALEPCLNQNNSCDAEKPVHTEQAACSDPKRDFKNSVETMIMKRLLQKANQSCDSQTKSYKRQTQMGRDARTKLRRPYKSPKRKSKGSSQNQTSDCNDSLSVKSVSKSLLQITDSSHLTPLSIEVGNLKALNENAPHIDETQPILLKRHSMVLGRKKFTLPIVSARSSRRIFPQKRYLQEEEVVVPSKISSTMEGSLSSVSPIIRKNNHMANSNPRNERDRGQHICASNRLLLAEGKRHLKSGSEMTSKKNTSFGLGKNRSTDCLSSCFYSASSSEFITPDMVSKYADKMAEKPKKRRLKNGDDKKSILQKPDGSIVIEKRKQDLSEKKPIDPLEMVAAKIEKILISPWEGRLKQTTNPAPAPISKPESSQTMKAKTSPLLQWKSEQEQRAYDRKHIKNLNRKPIYKKLQLKKWTLMKLRQPQSIALLNEQLQLPNSKTGAVSDKQQALGSPSSLDWANSPTIKLKKSPVPTKFDVPGTKACCVCGLSTTICQVQKYFGQLACDVCSKFFWKFIDTPKHYFCLKEGNCSSNVNATRNNKISGLRYHCKACWLRSCMQNFSVSAFLRGQLLRYVPRLDAPPHNPLIDDNKALSKMSNVVDFAPSVSEVVESERSKNSLDDTNKLNEFLVACQGSSISVLDSTHSETCDASQMGKVEPMTAGKQLDDENSTLLSADSGDSEMESPENMLKSNEKDVVVPETITVFNDGVTAPSSIIDEISISCEAEEMVSHSTSEESKASKPIKITLPGTDQNIVPLPKIDEVKARGPRIKYVSRRAAIVFGLPKATFTQPIAKHFNLSALPHNVKQKFKSL